MGVAFRDTARVIRGLVHGTALDGVHVRSWPWKRMGIAFAGMNGLAFGFRALAIETGEAEVWFLG